MITDEMIEKAASAAGKARFKGFNYTYDDYHRDAFEEGHEEGAKWMRSEMLKQAASGFEEYFDSFDTDRKRLPPAQDVWQAATLSAEKKIKDLSKNSQLRKKTPVS